MKNIRANSSQKLKKKFVITDISPSSPKVKTKKIRPSQVNIKRKSIRPLHILKKITEED